MSEMVERVARALAKLDDDLGYDEGKWRYCVSEARAAIEAMHHPSDDFLTFIAHAHDLRPQDWSEIIDAALNPQSQP